MIIFLLRAKYCIVFSMVNKFFICVFFLFLSLSLAQDRTDLDRFIDSESLNENAPPIASFIERHSWTVLKFGDLEPKEWEVYTVAEFDINGNETKACDIDTGCDVSAYNEQGLLVFSKSRYREETEERIYNSDNQISQIVTTLQNEGVTSTRKEEYLYNQNGDIVAYIDGGRREIYTYDEEGRLIEYRFIINGAFSKVETIEYTEGAFVKYIYNNPVDVLDFVIKHRTDTNGNLIDSRKFSADEKLIQTERYNRNGEVEERTKFNKDGSKEIELFDDFGVSIGKEEYFPNGDLDYKQQCEYTRSGNLKECWNESEKYRTLIKYDSQGREILNSLYSYAEEKVIAKKENDYRYDHRGNVVMHRKSDSLGLMDSVLGHQEKTVYTYDKNGNMTERRRLDSQDNLEDVTQCVYTYDENQNPKTKNCKTFFVEDGEWVLKPDFSGMTIFEITYY